MNSDRSHSDLPPSSADKWMVCHGWMRTVAQHRETYGVALSSEAADEGTRAHERMETILKGSHSIPIGDHEHDEDLAVVMKWIEEQAGILHSEVRVDFGHRFGYVDLTGTADVIIADDHLLTVADLKFGRVFVDVERNKQLMIYLSGAVDIFGPRSNYRLAILQPRAWYHGANKAGAIREYVVTDKELDAFRSDLHKAIEANYGNGKCSPGDHCRNFCPALASCRAASLMARQRFLEAIE